MVPNLLFFASLLASLSLAGVFCFLLSHPPVLPSPSFPSDVMHGSVSAAPNTYKAPWSSSQTKSIGVFVPLLTLPLFSLLLFSLSLSPQRLGASDDARGFFVALSTAAWYASSASRLARRCAATERVSMIRPVFV